MIWRINSTSLKATETIGASIGKRLRGGEVIELISDLGGGKTAFVRGLAEGMGIKEMVSSPSFTVSREYEGGHLQLHHYDFYRLQEPGIMAHEISEVLSAPSAVVAVEWADLVEGILPDERIRLMITTTGVETRQLQFEYAESLTYVIPKGKI